MARRRWWQFRREEPGSDRFGKQMLKKQTERQKAAENTSGGPCARDVSLKKLAAGERGESNMPLDLTALLLSNLDN